MTDAIQLADDDSKRRRLKNGAIYDMETHRIVENPGGGSTAITQASASMMAEARAAARAARIDATRRGMGKAVNGLDVLAIEMIAESHTKHAIAAGSRDSVPSARLVMEMGDYMDRYGDNLPANSGITVTIAPDLAREIMQMYLNRQDKGE